MPQLHPGTAALLLVACGPRSPTGALSVDAIPPDEPVDECHLPCLSAQVLDDGVAVEGAQLSLSAGGQVVASASTDASGEATLCLEPGSIAPGQEVQLGASVDDRQAGQRLDLDVRPFGWWAGRDRSSAVIESLLYTPDLSHADQAILRPEADTWYAYQVTSPTLSSSGEPDGGLFAFAGAASNDPTLDKNTYRIGVAWLEAGVITDISEDPILPAADDAAWDAASQNAPALLPDGDGLVMWYDGRHTPDSLPSIGRATSADGRIWQADPGNPVFDPGVGAGHPTVIDDGEGRVELWYMEDGELAYAISDDGGQHFEPFCGNPLGLKGKAPEVVWSGDRYLLAWTSDHAPHYRVYWAESEDGLRWKAADTPILESTDSDWESLGVVNGPVILDAHGVASLLYVGVGDGDQGHGNGVGLARAR